MPQVPVAPIPSTRNQSAVQAFQSGRGSESAAAFGFSRAGERFGAALQNVGAVTGQIATKLKADDDERLAKMADARMSAATRALLHGDENTPGFLASQGQHALDGAKGIEEQLEKTRRDIAKDLNPSAAKMFNDVAARRIERARDSIVGHTSRERAKADAVASTARINEYKDDAGASWSDPVAVSAAIAGARQEAADLAAKSGLDAETAASGIEAAETGIHAKVIDSMLANQVPAVAESYFKENRERIDGSAHAEIQRAITAAKNKQAVELRDDVNSAVAILDAGKTPENLSSLRAAVSGTKLAKPLDDAVADFGVMSDFNSKSLPDRLADIRALDGKETVNATDFRRLQKMQKAYVATAKRIAAGDGLGVAADAGMIDEPVTVDWRDPATLKARARQAELASRGLGARVAPLSPAEADGLADALEQAPAAQTGALLATLREGFGRENATAIAAQLAAGKRPEYGPAIILSEHAPQTAIDIIRGARLRRDAGGDLEMPVGDKRTAINETFGNAFEGAPEAMAPFTEAADALYAARRIPGGDLTFDADAYEKALHDATGGIVSFNGRNLIPPRPGMTADDVEDVLGQINDADDLAEVGNGIPMTADGTIVPADRLFGPAGLFRSGLGGQLVSVAPGVYRVFLPGAGFLKIESGDLFEIDLLSVLP